MKAAITLLRGLEVPPAWPGRPVDLVVLVGLDCRAVAKLALDYNDVVLLVSLWTEMVGDRTSGHVTIAQLSFMH
jgi:hypothetical protein